MTDEEFADLVSIGTAIKLTRVEPDGGVTQERIPPVMFFREMTREEMEERFPNA